MEMEGDREGKVKGGEGERKEREENGMKCDREGKVKGKGEEERDGRERR